jgi:hypothetical protein
MQNVLLVYLPTYLLRRCLSEAETFCNIFLDHKVTQASPWLKGMNGG